MKYLHGFTRKEQKRLYQQARFLEHIVHGNLDFSHAKNMLEVGSGVGAQTEILLRRNPEMFVTGIDISSRNIKQAKKYLSSLAFAKGRYEIVETDATDMNLPVGKYDGAFLCWILEHVTEPMKVLSEVRRVLREGSLVTVTEVLNATFYVEPYSPSVLKYWMRFNDCQYSLGGDPHIGAKLANFLMASGFHHIKTEVKTFHYDNRQPVRRSEMIEYWENLMLSGAPQLLKSGYVTKEIVEGMKKEMKAVAKNPNAVFFYSFVQAQAYS